MVFRRHGLALVIMLALLGGCGPFLKTPYSTPAYKAPARWQTQMDGENAEDSDWWENFNDADLNEWVNEALERNNNIAAAAIRIHRAQLIESLAELQFYPLPGASFSSSYSRPLSGDNRELTRTYGSSLVLGWEADLWGELASQQDIATWEVKATKQDRESAALALTGTVTKLYWQIAYLHKRIELSQHNIKYAEKMVGLAKSKHGGGTITELETAEAEQSLDSLQAQDLLLRQQLSEAHNMIGILFDAPPGEILIDPAQFPHGQLPAIAPGLPAELLGRRSDLRAAELRLRESLSNVDATRESYFPILSLTGALGTASGALVNFLHNPVASLGTSLVESVLDPETIDLNIGVSESQYDEAVVNFRQALYQAFSDVENSLSARITYAKEAKVLQQSLVNAQKAEHLYEERYVSGDASLRNWLEANETRRVAEEALLQNRLNRLNNYVTIYMSLGGDTYFDEDEESQENTSEE